MPRDLIPSAPPALPALPPVLTRDLGGVPKSPAAPFVALQAPLVAIPAPPPRPQGPPGPPGPQGARGVAGARGEPGAPGQTGVQGPAGPAGPQGLEGADGLDSFIPGPVGPVGGQGAPGQAGADGVDGLDSFIPGPIGPSGLTGGTGPAGSAGADGSDGLDSFIPGPIGPPGTPGTDGTIGRDGASGADGVDGLDSFIPGPIGPAGADGARGCPGAAGPDGIDGLDSFIPGPIGPAGGIGATGAAGLMGLMGPMGLDGADGLDSFIPGPIGPGISNSLQFVTWAPEATLTNERTVAGSTSITVNTGVPGLIAFETAAVTGAVSIAANGITSTFGTQTAKSLMGVPGNVNAAPISIAGSAAFQHVRINSANTGVEWSVLTTGDFPAGSVPITALASFPTWAQSLSAGATSGAFNATVDAAQYLGFGSAAATALITGQIRADGPFLIQGNGAVDIASSSGSGNITIQGGLASTAFVKLVGGDVILNPADDCLITTAGGDIILDALLGTTLSGASGLGSPGFLKFKEAASSTISTAAGEGMLWVDDQTPNQLAFTDDVNADWPVNTFGVAGLSGLSTVTGTSTATPVSFSVPANTFRVGSIYKIEAFGIFTRGATATALNVTTSLNLGGTAYATSAFTPFTVAGSGSFSVTGWLSCLSIGAAGTFVGNLRMNIDTINIAGANPTASEARALVAGTLNNAASATAKNTTAALTLSLTSVMSASVLGTSLTFSHAVITRVF
jgi:collagen triple helix repeat protein